MSFTAVLGSANATGRQVLIAATATPGTLLHTTHATAIDEVTVELTNNHTASVVATVEIGGVTSPNDLVAVTVPSKSGVLVAVNRRRLTGALDVRVFAATTNVISAVATVDRIT